MLITCPNCKTKFNIPPNAIGETGKKVKCTKCAHVWFQEPPVVKKAKTVKEPEAPQEKVEPNEEEDSQLPVKNHRKLYAAYIVLFIIIIGAGFALSPLKNISDNNGYFGVYDYSGVSFSELSVEIERLGPTSNFQINGKIKNSNESQIKLPEIEIQVLSESGNVMTSYKVPPPQEYIDPQGEVEFKPRLEEVSASAATISVKFGSWIEMML
jgi:predicted Zn finger-like uncharacterized protein